MYKEKLFTPEDFDKPKDKSIWQKYKSFWQKYKRWILGCSAILIILVTFLCVLFRDNHDGRKDTEISQVQTEQVIEGTEYTGNAGETQNIETENPQEVQKSGQGEKQLTLTSIADTHKEEISIDATAQQSANVSDNIEQEALNVIRGDYGNVPGRREILGSKYHEIQNRVNQLKREGVF